MTFPWKISKNHHRYRNADVLILSIGKSGRTWLRVLVNKYLSLASGVPFSLEDLSHEDPTLPSVVFAHEMWTHYTKATPWQRFRQKFIIPERMLRDKGVVLLYRDPRDVVVSMYFQLTKRSPLRAQYEHMSLSEFIRDEKFGIKNIVRVQNEWLRRLKDHPRNMMLRFEDIKADTEEALTRIIAFTGMEGDAALIKEAVEFSAFENMRKMEAKGGFKQTSMTPGDPNDPSSFKVREGKVGGYARHFGEEDLQYLNDAVKELDRVFGYRAE
jgi:hypothetical protein